MSLNIEIYKSIAIFRLLILSMRRNEKLEIRILITFMMKARFESLCLQKAAQQAVAKSGNIFFSCTLEGKC